MKNLILGLAIGILITGIGAYLSFPKYKQASYDEGYSVGLKEGGSKIDTNVIEEKITQGIAKVEAEKIAIQDSLNKEIEKAKASRRAVRIKIDEKPKIQNWRVLGNEIAEPIIEEESVKTP